MSGLPMLNRSGNIIQFVDLNAHEFIECIIAGSCMM
jgi:hypothetical protein